MLLLEKYFKNEIIVYCPILLHAEFTLNALLGWQCCVKHWCFSFWLIMGFSWRLKLFDWQHWDGVFAQLKMFNITLRLQDLLPNFFCLLILRVCMFLCICFNNFFHYIFHTWIYLKRLLYFHYSRLVIGNKHGIIVQGYTFLF